MLSHFSIKHWCSTNQRIPINEKDCDVMIVTWWLWRSAPLTYTCWILFPPTLSISHCALFVRKLSRTYRQCVFCNREGFVHSVHESQLTTAHIACVLLTLAKFSLLPWVAKTLKNGRNCYFGQITLHPTIRFFWNFTLNLQLPKGGNATFSDFW